MADLGQKLRITAVIGCAAIIGLTACSEAQLMVHTAKQMSRDDSPSPPPPPPPITGKQKIGAPYNVHGVWYRPARQPGYDETGIASWYGHPFHGRPTANGERFDMNLLTAAHRTLPLPSNVVVTNLENGRSIVVRVNDRGPFAHSRIIDLSHRAALELDFVTQGTAKVRVQLVDNDGKAAGGTFRMKQVALTDEDVKVAKPPARGEFSAGELPPPPGAVAAPAEQQPAPTKVAAADKFSFVTAAGNPAPKSVNASQNDLYIQAGAFTTFQNAHRLETRLSGLGPARISHTLINERDFYRVRVGPIARIDEADRLLGEIINLGYPEARIIVD